MRERLNPAFFERFFSFAHQEVKLAVGSVLGDLLVPLVVVEGSDPLDNLQSLAQGELPYGLFDFLDGAHGRITQNVVLQSKNAIKKGGKGDGHEWH